MEREDTPWNYNYTPYVVCFDSKSANNLGFGGIGTIIVGIIALIVINSDNSFSGTTPCTRNSWTHHFGNNSRRRIVDIRKNQANNLIISATRISSHQFDMILLLAASERTENIPMSNLQVKL